MFLLNRFSYYYYVSKVHAALAPLSTKLIDNVAYHGLDIRKRVRWTLAASSHCLLKHELIFASCLFCHILVFVCTQVALELSSNFKKKQASVLDLCCGVGFSTRALGEAFPDAEKIVGLDTSNEMLAMANFINTQINVLKPWYDTALNQGRKIQMGAENICSAVFEKGNAEQTPFQDASFDLVTIMYVGCCCCYCR